MQLRISVPAFVSGPVFELVKRVAEEVGGNAEEMSIVYTVVHVEVKVPKEIDLNDKVANLSADLKKQVVVNF